jgi:hypothetical protein
MLFGEDNGQRETNKDTFGAHNKEKEMASGKVEG